MVGQKLPEMILQMVVKQNCALPLVVESSTKSHPPKKKQTKDTSFLMGRPKNPGKINGWKLKKSPN